MPCWRVGKSKGGRRRSIIFLKRLRRLLLCVAKTTDRHLPSGLVFARCPTRHFLVALRLVDMTVNTSNPPFPMKTVTRTSNWYSRQKRRRKLHTASTMSFPPVKLHVCRHVTTVNKFPVSLIGNILCLVGMLRFIPPSPSGGINQQHTS